MRRCVLYDASSRAAAAAAHLLADEYDVGTLSADLVSDAVPTVLLIEHDSRHVPQMGRHVRMVALVDPAAHGPWSAAWYALVPVGAGRPLVASAVRNAFADLEAGAEIARLDRELSELNAIGIRLSAERNPRELLETILTKARETTNSDAGSLYLVDEAADGTRHLRFALAQNDSVEIPFRATTLPLTNDSVAGHVALTGKILNLEDAYAPPPGAPYHINPAFDEQTGYRTRSTLVVPMRTPQGETIGVLQLINCKPDFALRLGTREETERWVKPFGALLHDFGKVGVREQVLVKAKKLHPAELDRIRQRAELIKRGLQLRHAGEKIDYLLAKGKRRYREHGRALDEKLRASLTDLDASLARIVRANEPAILPRDFVEEIERLARPSFEDHLGGPQTLITPEEASTLV